MDPSSALSSTPTWHLPSNSSTKSSFKALLLSSCVLKISPFLPRNSCAASHPSDHLPHGRCVACRSMSGCNSRPCNEEVNALPVHRLPEDQAVLLVVLPRAVLTRDVQAMCLLEGPLLPPPPSLLNQPRLALPVYRLKLGGLARRSGDLASQLLQSSPDSGTPSDSL